MIYLSAFADEISPDLQEQLTALKRQQIRYLDLRGAWSLNVLDLSDEQLDEIQRTFSEQGIGVAAIGSPIGKVAIDSPFEEHLARFRRALEIAHRFQTPYIRIFSFYPPQQKSLSPDLASWREEVLSRLREMTRIARAEGIILLHENEKDIYGDTVARCVDLCASINDPHFRLAFDPANFIQSEQIPYPAGYEALRPWISYVHVKDAQADGGVVAAGEGLGRWPDFLRSLRADGYEGFFSLEPHLAEAGQFMGFTGPKLFQYAATAFTQMLHEMYWELS